MISLLIGVAVGGVIVGLVVGGIGLIVVRRADPLPTAAQPVTRDARAEPPILLVDEREDRSEVA